MNDSGRIAELENRLIHLNIVLEGYKVLAGMSDPDPFKVFGLVDGRIKELKAEVARLKTKLDNKDKNLLMVRGGYDLAMRDMCEMKAENLRLSEQLGKCADILKSAKVDWPCGTPEIIAFYNEKIDACLTSLSKG